MERNLVPSEFVSSSPLMTKLKAAGDRHLLECDQEGQVYFRGHFNNTTAVSEALSTLAASGYQPEVMAERDSIEMLFSDLFDCANFTGRSGGMYAYEGLGSIYWHMVSKLLLAVMETAKRAEETGADSATLAELRRAYYEVREGIGFNKTPDVYGAFPTDPYSHTPGFAGARQPGMTGQVKEEILTRLLELGVEVREAAIVFNPSMLRQSEFLDSPNELIYFDVSGSERRLQLSAGELGFTYCQVPVVMSLSSEPTITVHTKSGHNTILVGSRLSAADSEALFKKTGEIVRLDVAVDTVLAQC